MRRRKNPAAITETHPLAMLDTVTVRMEWDEESGGWVTFVPELNNISTFGETQADALDETRDLIVGYIRSMQSVGKPLPISAAAARKILHELQG